MYSRTKAPACSGLVGAARSIVTIWLVVASLPESGQMLVPLVWAPLGGLVAARRRKSPTRLVRSRPRI